MKLTRTAALILALAMVFALAGCGGEKAESIDTAALAGQLVEAASFGEPMNALDSAVALGLYGAPEGTTVTAYAGTGCETDTEGQTLSSVLLGCNYVSGTSFTGDSAAM